jgi:hypothetical protein
MESYANSRFGSSSPSKCSMVQTWSVTPARQPVTLPQFPFSNLNDDDGLLAG